MLCHCMCIWIVYVLALIWHLPSCRGLLEYLEFKVQLVQL